MHLACLFSYNELKEWQIIEVAAFASTTTSNLNFGLKRQLLSFLDILLIPPTPSENNEETVKKITDQYQDFRFIVA